MEEQSLEWVKEYWVFEEQWKDLRRKVREHRKQLRELQDDNSEENRRQYDELREQLTEEERMEGDIEGKMERMKLEEETCRWYKARSLDDDPKGVFPLVYKQGPGGQMHAEYKPWSFGDIAIAAKSLPIMSKGAEVWIREFETRHGHQNLCLGDMKAILSRALTHGQFNDVMIRCGLLPQPAELELSQCRQHLWDCLRDMSPTMWDRLTINLDPTQISEIG